MTGFDRRTLLTGAAAGLATAAFPAPAVRGQGRKTLRFLNTETSLDSVRALRVAAAEYERAAGTNGLLKEGAILVTELSDITDQIAPLIGRARAGRAPRGAPRPGSCWPVRWPRSSPPMSSGSWRSRWVSRRLAIGASRLNSTTARACSARRR